MGFQIAKLVLPALLFIFSLASHAQTCAHPWMFFDLGNTIVDTKTNNYNPMFYLADVQRFADGHDYKSSRDYLAALKNEGYLLGLVMDVPEAWGKDYPSTEPLKDYVSAKILRTMDFLEGKISDDKSSWLGDVMDWSPFGTFAGTGIDRVFVGRVFVPRTTAERKRSNSTVIFAQAFAQAQKAGCKALYQGESEAEMTLAEQAGLATFRVGSTNSSNFYLPISQIDSYVDSYVPGNWRKSLH